MPPPAAPSYPLGHPLVLAPLFLALVSCSASQYAASADKEVATILSRAHHEVPTADADSLDIQPSAPPRLDSLERHLPAPDDLAFLGERIETEQDARVLGLADALELAVTHSREYQGQKEVLFLSALELTGARHEFAPIFAGVASGSRDSELIDDLSRRVSYSGAAGLSVSQLKRSGARITSEITTDLLRIVNGEVANSARLAATLTQPLLRGAGQRVTLEALTQAERDLLYALRSFARFRQQFSVDTAAAYYRVLQNRDSARNAYLGLENFRLNLQRERQLFDADRRTRTELGQVEQATLNAELSWINSLRNYEQSLDEFKISLALPVDTPLILDPDELSRLSIERPALSLAEAIGLAVDFRLDLDTSRDKHEDSARKIAVAANQLKPSLNVIARYSLGTDSTDGLPTLVFERSELSTGFDVDLGLDRLDERNTYRTALIDHQRTARQLALDFDQVKLSIRNAWRDLEQAERQYQVSLLAVRLANERLDLQRELNEQGLGTARDLVEAQEDVVSSQDERTSALVNHTLARLRFWRDVGILKIEPSGSWEPAATEPVIAPDPATIPSEDEP
jgi:outer membrane protein TolC